MSVYEVYHNLTYLAWYSKTAKKYQKIMEDKPVKKK